MSASTEFESPCTCAICMEELGTNVEACPCGHVYHRNCIRQWVQQKPECPQCKQMALPLMPLKFNLFRISKEEKAFSSADRVCSLRADISTTKLNIEMELDAINVLEPQLALNREEEQQYSHAIELKQAKNASLELEFEKLRSDLYDAEARRRKLAEETESMRAVMSRVDVDIPGNSSSSISRQVQSSEIPKLVSFVVADSKRLAETAKERAVLVAELSSQKKILADLNRRLRAVLGEQSSSSSTVIKHSMKNVNIHANGFVPIDAISHKRKQEETRLKELESKRPCLFESSNNENASQGSNEEATSLQQLSHIVSMLSDNEDIMDTEEVQPPIFGDVEMTQQIPQVGPMDQFFSNPPKQREKRDFNHVIVLDS